MSLIHQPGLFPDLERPRPVREWTPDDFTTPRWLWLLVLALLGGIDLDPCSNEWSTVPATTRYTIADDSLAMAAERWRVRRPRTRCLLNPPYSDPAAFLERVAFLSRGPGFVALAIIKTDHSTAWWRSFVRGRPRVYLDRRVCFGDHDGEKATGGKFASSVVLYDHTNRLVPRLRSTFEDVGEVVAP